MAPPPVPDVRMTDYITAYLSDPDTWHRVATAFIEGVAGALGAALLGWLFNLFERRPRRRAPRPRDDG